MNILTRNGKAETDVRHSRFVAESFSVSTQEEARTLLKRQKELYADSSHVVHAFVIGATGGILGCSDDGEPSGTAGRPALDALKGSGITNILVTVARWFGGIELGTGGLVKAYGAAVRAVLEVSHVCELVPMLDFSVTVSYEMHDRCRREIDAGGIEISEEIFGTAVDITGRVRETAAASFCARISDLTAGQSSVALSAENPTERKT